MTLQFPLGLLAGSVGFEPTSYGFGDRRVTITPETYMVGEDRFELPNPKEQIYSLPRLATSLLPHWRPR